MERPENRRALNEGLKLPDAPITTVFAPTARAPALFHQLSEPGFAQVAESVGAAEHPVKWPTSSWRGRQGQ